MENKNLIKETLLGVGMVGVSAGMTMLMAKDIFGLVVIAVGLGVIFLRGYLKTQ
jgi:hypothetical protein